jgi:hypothetical protein
MLALEFNVKLITIVVMIHMILYSILFVIQARYYANIVTIFMTNSIVLQTRNAPLVQSCNQATSRVHVTNQNAQLLIPALISPKSAIQTMDFA